MARKQNLDRLGLGARRGITVTVTTTPTTLADLLNTASPGRTLHPGLRQINFQNTSGSTTIYILENSSQTVTEGVQIPSTAGANERFYETSTTAWGANSTLDNDTISGSYFATSSGTATMVVEELA